MLDSKPEQEPPLIDELKQLGDEARAYAEAEFAFQKTRVIAVGNAARKIAVLGLWAFVIAVFALVALVAGLLMALSSLVGPWWATAIVAGGLVLLALGAVLKARTHWRRIKQRLFIDGEAK